MNERTKEISGILALARQADTATKEGNHERARQLFQEAVRKCEAPTAPDWSLRDLDQAGYLETVSAKLAAAGFDKWAKDIQNRAAWIYRAEEAEYKGTYRGF